MTEHDVAAEKARVRERVRALRRAIPAERRQSDAAALAEALIGMDELADVRLVSGYGATPEEIDPEPALARLRARGVRVAYPRVAGSVLEMCEVNDAAELEGGCFGIREPCADAPPVNTNDLDAVLVPAVAFDRRGYRVGYGGGFYDRLLATLPERVLRVGLAFDEQLADELPTDSHDQPVDLIVTPSTIINVRPRGARGSSER